MRATVVRRRRFRVLEPLDPRMLDAEELRKINPDLLTLFNVNTPRTWRVLNASPTVMSRDA